VEIKEIKIGTASIYQNPLTGGWLIHGQKGENGASQGNVYRADNKRDAVAMAKTVDHWNKTGEVKAF
jgi:hypothetical protein